MKREQWTFLSAGVVLGFVIGFVVAWGLGRGPGPGRAGSLAPAPLGRASMPPGSSDGESTMDQVTGDLTALKERLQHDPNDVSALVELASLYMQVSMFDQAREYLVRAVDASPDDLHARTHLGIVLSQLGELGRAREQFERTVSIDPAYWEGWYYLAVATAQQGDVEASQAAVTQLEELYPTLPELAELKAHLAEAVSSGP